MFHSFVSKLRFDGRLVDHRPDLHNSLVAKLIEDVLGEIDSSAVYRQPKKEALWAAIESQPARDVRRIADHKLDVELEVRNLLEIALEHSAIAGKAEWPAIVARVIGDEAMQIRPILPVQAGDVAPLEVGESDFGHDVRSAPAMASKCGRGELHPPLRYTLASYSHFQ